MSPYPFALSLNAAMQVSADADGYCLAPEGADASPGVISSMVTLPSLTGMGDALAQLREGGDGGSGPLNPLQVLQANGHRGSPPPNSGPYQARTSHTDKVLAMVVPECMRYP